MLKKCLKYDLQAVGRVWWILIASMLGAALISGLAFRAFFEVNLDPDSAPNVLKILTVIGMIGALLCILGMFAALVISVIIVYWRIYTNFYTDEGYLTFTLPVKRSTLYLSKVLTATIVETATILMFILSIVLILLIAPPSTHAGQIINPVALTGIGDLFGDLFKGLIGIDGGGWVIVWLIAAIPFLLMSQLYASGLVFLCMTIGSVIAKKHKLLAAIGLYYGFTAAISFVSQFAALFLSAGVFSTIGIASTGGITAMGLTVTAIILIADLVMACLATLLHFITVHLLEKKLNLA
ncbi:MAG: hypothetical protein IJA91_05730 [Clostridia bacterium]|nr:hypothetical protein [Clostridia bacterium]